MVDTYTQALKARKIEEGAYPEDWANRLNADVVDIFDAGISGQIEIDIGSATTYALPAMQNGTLSVSHYWRLNFVGTPASAVTVTVPASVTPSKEYLISNETGQSLTIKYAATSGVTVADGEIAKVLCNGTTVSDVTLATLTQSMVGLRLYPQTAAESTASATIVYYFISPGDVRRYGAIGNGTTDCTTAFQAAINQANHASGAEVFIPQGTWRIISALTGARGLKMAGAGRYRSIVLIEGNINFLTFTGTVGNPDGGAMLFRDFTVKGSSSSGSHFDFNYGGQTEFHGMRFWLGGAAAGAFVVLNTECHRTSFKNCLFQTWENAAVLTSGVVNSILSFVDCQFNANGTDGIVAGTNSCCLSLGSGEQIYINSCNVNGDDALNHFIRFTGDGAGNAHIGECYVEHITQSAIVCTSNVVINGMRIENCNLSCDNSVSIDLSAGNEEHRGIQVKNIRRPESDAVFILSTGSGIVDFEYSGTLLDGSADHVVGYPGQAHVRKFADGTHFMGSRNRHVIGPWTQDNVSGTIGATAMAGTRFIAPRAGRVTGVIVKSTEARTAGTLTVNVFKNTGLSGAAGSVLADSPSADLNGTNTSVATGYTQDHDASFNAGDEIYMTYQTSGFTPTTADIRSYVEIEM